MKFHHLASFRHICYFTVDFEVVLVKGELIVCNDNVPNSSPGARFSKGPVTFRARNQIFK